MVPSREKNPTWIPIMLNPLGTRSGYFSFKSPHLDLFLEGLSLF